MSNVSAYEINEANVTKFLVTTYHLLQAHGFDDGNQHPDKVPLRLSEAFRLTLNEFSGRSMMFIDPDKRALMLHVYDLLEARMGQFHPSYDTLNVWLAESATQDDILSLIANLLQDFGATP